MAQQPPLPSAPVGRNNPCPCGSGKKYKKCCLPKHQAERLAAQATAEAKVLKDEWMPGRDYVAAARHPLTMFDQFFLEMLNVIGGAVRKCTRWNQPQIGSVLTNVMGEGRKFYAGCWTCKHGCLRAPMRKVSFQSLIDKGLRIEEFPAVLQRPLALNFFYFEFMNLLMHCLDREVSSALSAEQVDDLIALVDASMLSFIVDNCWAECDNQCMQNPGKSSYCAICMFTEQGLLCPKRGEISYAEIATFPDEMMH